MHLLRPGKYEVRQRIGIDFLRNPISAKVGKLASNGMIVAGERCEQCLQMRL
jgi:hypothetical protein